MTRARRPRPVLFLLAFVLSLLFSVFAHADPLSIQATNLANASEADAFAREWVRAYEAKSPDRDEPVLLLHVGNELPEQLKWVMVHLDRARIPYELKLITKAELEAELDESKNQALELLSFNADEKARRNTTRVWEKSKLALKRVFGVPGGVTFWVRMKSEGRQRLLEAGTAAFQSAQAGLTLGASLYLVQRAGTPVHIAEPVGFLMAWVWANIDKIRPIVEVMTQGRVVKEVAPGQFKVKPSRLFFYTATIIRQSILNALIVGAAFGWDQVLTAHQLHQNFENVGLSLVAGSWVEQWINSKQAQTGPDGKVIPREGQWSPAKTIVINTVWNTFYYGIVRNLHLLNFGSYGKWTYYAMAAVGTAVTLYEERYWMLGKAKALARAVDLLRQAHCETLLVTR